MLAIVGPFDLMSRAMRAIGTPSLKRASISDVCLRSSAVRTLWARGGGPGFKRAYWPCFTKNLRTVMGSHSKAAAIERSVSPFLRLSSISGKRSSNLRVTYGPGPPLLTRPLRTLSSMLSWCVPRNRWSGLTHPGVSQWCRHCKPSGISPLATDHEKRCARTMLAGRLGRNWPYPFAVFPPVHSQQPSSGNLITFSKNLSCDVLFIERYLKLFILLIIPTFKRIV